MKSVKFFVFFGMLILFNDFNTIAQTFSNLGSGLSNYPRTMFSDTSTGILYVGGDFLDAGGISVQHIAKWNGLNWDSLSGSVFWNVKDIEKYKDTIYAVSDYPGGVQKWDGTIWKDIGNTLNVAAYGLFATDSNLYISGWFDTIGGVNSRYIARYDGNSITSYQSFADPGWGANNSIIYNNDLYIAGNFENTQNPLISDMAYLQNSSWLPIVNGIQSSFGNVNCFTIFQNKLVIGGTFQITWGDPGNSILMWDGTSLTQPGSGINGDVWAMIVYNNELYVGGSITSPGGQYGTNLLKWDGSQWIDLNLIFNNAVSSLAVMNNELYIGGAFTQVNGVQISRIMKLTLPVNDQIIEDEPRFAIYPNPSKGKIYFNRILPSTAIVKLLDASGRLILTSTLSYELDINGVENGIYVLKVYENETDVYHKNVVIIN